MINWLVDSFYSGCIGIWWHLGAIPHYSWHQYGELLKGFCWLIPARVAYGIFFPERVVIRRVQNRVRFFRKRTVRPSKTDHQVASAAIFDVLTHH